jgi:hypothetical protein
MVRDHRNSPLLLVRLNEPCTAANQLMYASTGTAPASSEAPTRRHPAFRISRKSGTSRTSGKVVGRTVTDAPIIRPATATRHTGGDRRSSRTVNDPIIKAIASRSAMMNCSTSIWAGSNSTGAAASVAPQSGSP